MFGDHFDEIVDEIEVLLMDFNIEELLENADLEPAEALAYLVVGGYVKLKDLSPLR